jgi:protein-tyrosine phosphatase
MMSDYKLTWITDQLAVGYAPLSYADLDLIRSEGIDAIVNLCGEYCDLHEIEEKTGFEVFYLPIADECAPDMEEMEKALAWLDEGIYLGKNILVHCRHGIGRTGTFVTSYLLRRGLGLKVAEKRLKGTRANPTNYCQWRLLKNYSKKSGVLKTREPSLKSSDFVDLRAHFSEYETLVRKIDGDIEAVKSLFPAASSCGAENDECCYRYFDLELIEAAYLSNQMNRILKSDFRRQVILRAIEVSKQTREITGRLSKNGRMDTGDKAAFVDAYNRAGILCPLNNAAQCSLYKYRPIGCRLHNAPEGVTDIAPILSMRHELSRNIFFSLSECSLEDENLSFSLADTVSGKFVQQYFNFLANARQR